MSTQTNPPGKLIAIYARVSTERQEEEGTIENQILSTREFAAKNNLTIVEQYTDDGWSGDSLERPGLDQLRMNAKRKLWDAVLIYDPDRLARRAAWQEVVMEELKEEGVEVLFVTIPPPKTDEDVVMYKMRGVFSEYERMKIKERLRMGKVRKVKEGHILVSTPLYGYHYVPKHQTAGGERVHGHYEINPEEARVVKMIFGWIADEGLTIRAVVRRLKDMSIKPRKSKRGVWNTSTLTSMLRNRTYIGEARWGSSYAVVPEKAQKVEKYRKVKKTSRRTKPQEEWITSSIPVPVIIEREQFERARKQIETNFAQCQRNRKNEYLLAGVMRCVCGRTRSGEGALHGKHLYYRCSDRVLCHPLPPQCNEGGINARIADEMVWERVSKLMNSSKLLTQEINKWARSQVSRASGTVADVAAIRGDIRKLREQEERYNKAYGAGVYTLEQLQEFLVPVREKISDSERQIARSEQDAREQHIGDQPTNDEIARFVEKVRKGLKRLSFQQKREIVVSVIEKIVASQQEMTISGNVPVTSSYVEFKTISRHRRAAKRREIDPF